MGRELNVVEESSIYTTNPIRTGTRMHGRGVVVKVHPNTVPQKAMCHGCNDDFYNGKNSLGVTECWMFKESQVVDKVGYADIHVIGGPNLKMVKTLDCWHAVRK